MLEAIRQKEQSDKNLPTPEVFIGVVSVVSLLTLVFLSAFVPMADWLRGVLIAPGFILMLTGCACGLRIEQIAGSYECRACGHRYVPTYRAVTMAPHTNRTRDIRCPECEKKTWQKKTIIKE